MCWWLKKIISDDSDQTVECGEENDVDYGIKPIFNWWQNK